VINLLPVLQKEKLLAERNLKLVFISGIVIFAVLISLGLLLFLAKNSISADLEVQKIYTKQKETELQLPRLIDLEKKINNANATFSELSLFYKNGGSLVDILTKISRALPQGIYLTSINANPSLTQFSLTGFSKTREILLILKGNLEKETSFAEIYFPPENWVAPIDVNFVVNFKIK